MACMSTNKRARLLAQLEKKEAQLLKAETAYDTLLDSGDIESYSFDSGEGRQSTKRRALDSLEKTIDRLEAQIDALVRRLQGTGIMNITLSRRENRRNYY